MLLCLALAVPAKAVAQQPAGATAAPAQPADQKPPDQTPPPDQPTEAPKYEDQVIVTASRVEQKLVNAPATVSLISAQTIASAPSASYAELLRGVPGMNVTQTSARDINLVSRSATGTLSTSQLALIDGRSIYQDFFGFVAWDFLPVNTNEIKQIEVIRGPASAVWGANALTGVVNVITKSPREILGESLIGDRRHVRPRRQRRRAVERFAVLGLGQPRGRAVRHGGLQDHRRLLDAGGARPAQRADPERHQHALSRLREHRHQPAEAGRPRRLRLPRQGEQAGVRRRLRRHGGDDPHRHRPLRHRSRHLPRLWQGQLQPRRDAGQRVRQPSRRRRHQPPVARHHRHVHPVLVQEHDLRRRGERHPHLAQHARLQLRRQRPLQQLRSVARPPRRFADGSRRLRPGRVVHLRALPRRDRRPGRQVLVDRRRRVLAADHVHVQAGGVADGARVVQSRLSRAIARQQLPRRDAGQRARSRRPQSGPGRPAVHLPERGDRQCRI